MDAKETIKHFLQRGEVMKIHQWARENQTKDIERLIDAAAHELHSERPTR